jgi:hypothetical protein
MEVDGHNFTTVSIQVELTAIAEANEIDLLLCTNSLRDFLDRLSKRYSKSVDISFDCPDICVTIEKK